MSLIEKKVFKTFRKDEAVSFVIVTYEYQIVDAVSGEIKIRDTKELEIPEIDLFIDDVKNWDEDTICKHSGLVREK